MLKDITTTGGGGSSDVATERLDGEETDISTLLQLMDAEFDSKQKNNVQQNTENQKINKKSKVRWFYLFCHCII